MNLKELSRQYRESGECCRRQAEKIQAQLEDKRLSTKQKTVLHRQLNMVSTMARDAIATSNFLSGYYGKGEARHGR